MVRCTWAMVRCTWAMVRCTWTSAGVHGPVRVYMDQCGYDQCGYDQSVHAGYDQSVHAGYNQSVRVHPEHCTYTEHAAR